LGGLACFSLSPAFFLTTGLGEKKARQIRLLREQAKTGKNKLNKQKQFGDEFWLVLVNFSCVQFRSDEGAIGL
jgi:hypothetical protein